jgi:hypothetical protein
MRPPPATPTACDHFPFATSTVLWLATCSNVARDSVGVGDRGNEKPKVIRVRLSEFDCRLLMERVQRAGGTRTVSAYARAATLGDFDTDFPSEETLRGLSNELRQLTAEIAKTPLGATIDPRLIGGCV